MHPIHDGNRSLRAATAAGQAASRKPAVTGHTSAAHIQIIQHVLGSCSQQNSMRVTLEGAQQPPEVTAIKHLCDM
jgi:hypothetical protein